MIATIEAGEGLRAEDYKMLTGPARLNRMVGLSMALQSVSRRTETEKSKVRVGRETLRWLKGEVALDSVDVPAADTVCRLGSVAKTDGVFSYLNSEVDEQLKEGQAVVALEIVNWVNAEFEPDQTIRNTDPTVPPIYRVNHSMREGNISLFFVKERGRVEGSSFFWTASRRERAGRLLAELANHGYIEVIDNISSEEPNEGTAQGEILIVA